MSVDVFGRSLPDTVNRDLLKGPPGIGFSLNETGDYDIEKKRLCNVANAIEKNDAVNLSILERKIEQTEKTIQDFKQGITKFRENLKRILEDFSISIEENKNNINHLENIIVYGEDYVKNLDFSKEKVVVVNTHLEGIVEEEEKNERSQK